MSPAHTGGASRFYAELAVAADSHDGDTRALNVNSGYRPGTPIVGLWEL